MNFVFVSLQRIGTGRESTSTSLAKELSKNHRVLYVNPPLDRKTWLSRNNDSYTKAHIKLVKEKKAGLLKASENLWILNPEAVLESINWIPFTALFSIMNKVNNKKFAKNIKSALHELQFDSFIIINDKDMFRSYYLKELLKPKLYIYLDRDFTLGIDYWKKHGTLLEPLLMQKADAVVCNSIDFVKNASRYNKNSFYIGNGVDVELFTANATYEKPKELKNLVHPIIGYVGALNALRLDLDLLVQAVESRPDLSFVFIGEEDDTFLRSKLHNLSNAYFFGNIHKTIIPTYIYFFDVCINPQVVNKITIGNFPLKIIEYLAMGKPVVAISTNTMKEVFSSITHLAQTPEEFIMALDNALQEGDNHTEQRIAFANNFTWEKVVGLLLKHIKQVESNSKCLLV